MAVWALSLSAMDLSTHSLSAVIDTSVFGVYLGLVRLWAPLAHLVLYPDGKKTTLYLNRFRGEPAISEFDWPFTPSHKSSHNIATLTGSALH